MKPQDGDRIVSITVFVDNRLPEELPEAEVAGRRLRRPNHERLGWRTSVMAGCSPCADDRYQRQPRRPLESAVPDRPAETDVYADEFSLYAGNANKPLAERITRYLKTQLGEVEVFQFANENIFVRVMENVREQDVFLVQPTSRPVNQSIMEPPIMIDAFSRASAGRITAVIPYYSYGRSDKKDQPRCRSRRA